MIKAVIFDFDGAFTDTEKYAKKILEKLSLTVSDEDFKAHHDGNVFENPKIAFDNNSADLYHLNYTKNITSVKSFFTLNEVELLNKNYSLFILSSNVETAINKFLSYNNMKKYFQTYGYETHKSKIEKFKILFKENNLKKEECVFITDTLGDILEANEVGVKTIAVDFGFHDKERLEKGNPYKIVSTFEEIIKEIENLN